MSTIAAPPEIVPGSIEPAQLEAWRARVACGFPAVQDVLADCLLEARAALSAEGMDAWLDWLLAEPSAAAAPVEAVAARIAALEAELAKLRALPA